MRRRSLGAISHGRADARGALVGLAANHGRGHIIRAILEGVAFSLRDSFSIFADMNVPVSSIRLGGGGARSALWRQIQADVYAHDVQTIHAQEGSAFGAALLAGVGAKAWPSVDAACAESVSVSSVTKPNSNDSAALQKQYAAFRRLYPALRSIRTGGF